jgi:hypothetical protein
MDDEVGHSKECPLQVYLSSRCQGRVVFFLRKNLHPLLDKSSRWVSRQVSPVAKDHLLIYLSENMLTSRFYVFRIASCYFLLRGVSLYLDGNEISDAEIELLQLVLPDLRIRY